MFNNSYPLLISKAKHYLFASLMRVRGFFCVVTYILLLTFTLSHTSFAANEPLPASQAFSVGFLKSSQTKMAATFKIAPGYFIYAKKVFIHFKPKINAKVVLPQGEFQYDATRGRFEAYAGTVEIPITISPESLKTNNPKQALHVIINFQGCSRAGFCYPPQEVSFPINAQGAGVYPMPSYASTNATDTTSNTVQKGKSTSLISLKALFSNQNEVQSFLHSQNIFISLLLFFGFGLLLSLTPCILPMIPILAAIIVGADTQKSTRKAFSLAMIYVLGSSIAYAIAGLIASALGYSLQVHLQQLWVMLLFSVLFLFLALSLLGLYDLHLPRRLQDAIAHFTHKQQGGTYIGVFSMGFISTLIVSPCVSAPLVGVLLYIGNQGDIVYGMLSLFVMGLGMGVPLLLIGLSAEKFLPRKGPWMGVIKKGIGVMMIAMAIWLPIRFTAPTIPAASFTVVHNMMDLKTQLAEAKRSHQPVMLDFYADWCDSCIAMDKQVFSKPNVQQQLNKFVLLRIDLSKNTFEDQNLLKHFGVIAPPTILFFNAQGQEMQQQRILGEMSATKFISEINALKSLNCDATSTC